LVEENGFTDSDQSVKRFVRKLRAARPEHIWRMESHLGSHPKIQDTLANS
jgi:hypothetical protein